MSDDNEENLVDPFATEPDSLLDEEDDADTLVDDTADEEEEEVDVDEDEDEEDDDWDLDMDEDE